MIILKRGFKTHFISVRGLARVTLLGFFFQINEVKSFLRVENLKAKTPLKTRYKLIVKKTV